MIYAITNIEGVATYELTFEEAKVIYEEGYRIWESEDGGITYYEIQL